MCLVIKGSWHVTWTSSSSFLFVQAGGVPTELCAKMRNFVQFVLWYFISCLEPSRFVDILKDIFLEVFLMCQLVWKTKIMWLIEVKSHGCTIFLKLKKTKHVLLIIKHSGCDLSAHTDTHTVLFRVKEGSRWSAMTLHGAAAAMAFDFNEPHSLGFSNQLTRQKQPITTSRDISLRN